MAIVLVAALGNAGANGWGSMTLTEILKQGL
jgi:hypothetical protein